MENIIIITEKESFLFLDIYILFLLELQLQKLLAYNIDNRNII